MNLLTGVAWSAVRSWGSRFINLAVFFVAARYLTPDDLGVFSLVFAYLLVMQVLGEGGLAEYIVQRSEQNHSQDSAIFYAQLAGSSTLAIFIAATAPWLAPLLIKHKDAASIFALAGIVIPLAAMARVPEAILRKALRFKVLAYRGLLTSAIAGSVAMVMAYRGFGVWALLIKQILEAGCDALLIFLASRWNPGLPKLNRSVLQAPYAYGKHIIGARLLDTLYLRFDSFMIGNFISSSALGYYAVGQKVYQALFELLSKIFSNVAIPYMAREKNDPASVKRIYLQFLQLVASVAVPAFVCIFIFSGEIISLLFGDRWAQSAWILRAFCVLGAVNCVAFFNGHLLMAMGDSKAYFIVEIKKTAMLIAFCLLGVQFGLEGVVVAVVLAGILVTPFPYWKMRDWIDVGTADISQALSKGVGIALLAALAFAGVKLLLANYRNMENILLGVFACLLIAVAFHFGRSRKRIST